MTLRESDGFQTVRTEPCPRCKSRSTEVTIRKGVVLWRLCNSCAHEWDNSTGQEVLDWKDRYQHRLRGSGR